MPVPLAPEVIIIWVWPLAVTTMAVTLPPLPAAWLMERAISACERVPSPLVSATLRLTLKLLPSARLMLMGPPVDTGTAGRFW